MPAIRPEFREDYFVTPKMADPGLFGFLGAVTDEALTYSPIPSAYRWSNLTFAKGEEDTKVLSAEEANTQYGLDGEITFEDAITDEAAKLMHNRKLAELRRQYLMTSGGEGHWGRRVIGFGVSMAAQVVDPVNLASMFVPVVGESRLLQGAGRARNILSSGLISPKALAKFASTTPWKFRTAKGAIEGAVGTAIIEPLVAIPAHEEQADYGWGDSAANVIFGTVLGGGLHNLGGILYDKFASLSRDIRRLDAQTHESATLAAVNDIVRDEPVTSAADVINVDAKVVKQELKWDAKKARAEAMAELGISISKTKQEVRNPVEFKEEEFSSAAASLKKTVMEFESDEFPEITSLFEIDYADRTYTTMDFTGGGLARFRKFYQMMAEQGYNLGKAQVKMGSESIVFILDDKVIKLNLGLDHPDIPGVVLPPERTFQFDKANVEIYEKADIRFEQGEGSKEYLNTHAAFELFGAKHGWIFHDAHEGNIGFTKNEMMYLIDSGMIEKSETPVSERLGYFEGLMKNATPEQIRLFELLEDQHELAKVSPQQVSDEMQKRIKSLVEKKRREFKKAQKIEAEKSKAEPEVDKTVVDDPIQKTPDELEPHTAKTVKESLGDVEKEISELERELEAAFEEMPEDLKKMVEVLDEEIENTKKIASAVKKGAECMINKVS